MATSAQEFPIFEKLENEKVASAWVWILRTIPLSGAFIFYPSNVINFLTEWSWSFWSIFLVTFVLANIQIIYSFFFWRWIAKESAKLAIKKVKNEKRIQEAIQVYENAKEDLEGNGFITKYRSYVLQWFHGVMTGKRENKLVRRVKGGSLFLIFGLGLAPLDGARTITMVIVGAFHWKTGLYVMLAANSLRLFIAVRLTAEIKKLLGESFKWFAIGFPIVLIVFLLIKFFPIVIKIFLAVDSFLNRKLLQMNQEI